MSSEHLCALALLCDLCDLINGRKGREVGAKDAKCAANKGRNSACLNQPTIKSILHPASVLFRQYFWSANRILKMK